MNKNIFFLLITFSLACSPKGPQTFDNPYVGKTKTELIEGRGEPAEIKKFEKAYAYIYKKRQECFRKNPSSSKYKDLTPYKIYSIEQIYYVNIDLNIKCIYIHLFLNQKLLKMKKIILSLSILVAAYSSQANKVDHDNLTLNKEVSSVEWVGEKVTGKHSGTIQILSGTFHLHDNSIGTGEVVIDMTSINNTDMKAGQGKEKLEGHLKAKDFFDVTNHKTASLKITSTKKLEGNNYTIIGKLTIKGITKSIEFPANIQIKDGKLAAYAEMKVDRTLYDIKYGSGKFFDGLGDKTISDEFIIKFKIGASK